MRGGTLDSFQQSPFLKALGRPRRRDHSTLADCGPCPNTAAMFVVSEVEAAAIRAAVDHGGELSAAVELRRLFLGVTDSAQARECARTIAGRKPLAPLPPRLGRARRE